MTRFMKLMNAASTCALAVIVAAGCSSSSKPLITTPTAPAGSGSGAAAVGIAVGACSLATTDQVKALLGTSASGGESDFSAAYKSCSWTGGGSTMKLGVIRIGGGQVGFYPKVVGLTAVEIQGVGDKATYSSGKNTGGQNEVLLVVNKGTVSVSVDVRYGGASLPPASNQDVLVSIARNVFIELGA